VLKRNLAGRVLNDCDQLLDLWAEAIRLVEVVTLAVLIEAVGHAVTAGQA
jgi:hypothetical protein